ncbi:hypothetical protein C8F01DRAFT_1248011 [Mycena amicta]|nr:hypothetical protein C8F01DRAFT_1248011 [Mycena amicta]
MPQCNICSLVFPETLKYHHRITHQEEAQVKYADGTTELLQRENGKFHCRCGNLQHRDPGRVREHALLCGEATPGLVGQREELPTPSAFLRVDGVRIRGPLTPSAARSGSQVDLPGSGGRSVEEFPQLDPSKYSRLPEPHTFTSHPEVDIQGCSLAVNTKIGAIVCLDCGKGVSAAGRQAYEHVLSHGRVATPPQDLGSQISAHFPVKDIRQLVHPTGRLAPFFGFAIRLMALLFCSRCHHGFKNHGSLRTHQHEHCPRKQNEEDSYYISYGQSFGFTQAVFAVDPTLLPARSSEDLFAVFTRTLPPPVDYSQLPVVPAEDKQNLDQFFFNSGWQEHVYPRTPYDLNVLSQIPKEYPHTEAIKKLLTDYMECNQLYIRKHDSHGLMRSIAQVSDTDTDHEFRPLEPHSRTEYVKETLRVVTALMWEALHPFVPDVAIPALKPWYQITDEQRDNLLELNELVSRATSDPQRLRCSLHTTLFLIFTQKLEHGGISNLTLPVMSYLVARAMGQANWVRANHISPVIAKLKYAVREVVLYQIEMDMVAEQLSTKTAYLRYRHLLIDGDDTVMTALYHNSRRFKAIRGGEYNESSSQINSPDGRELLYNGTPLHLHQVGAMHRGLHHEVERIEKEDLFPGREIPDWYKTPFDIAQIQDDPRNNEAGYCFIDNPQNELEDKGKLYPKFILQDPELAQGGLEEAHRYHTYLWPGTRRNVTGEEISQALGDSTEKYFGQRLQILDWRHVAIAWCRHFDMTLWNSEELGFDLLSNHSTDTSERFYAVDEATIAHAKPTVVRKLIETSFKWTVLTGITEDQPTLTLTPVANLPHVLLPDRAARFPDRILEHDGAGFPVDVYSDLGQQLIAVIDKRMDERLTQDKSDFAKTMTPVVASIIRQFGQDMRPQPSQNRPAPQTYTLVHAAFLRDFRDFLGDQTASWRTPKQGELAAKMFEGGQHLLAVLGPDSGKTTLIFFQVKMYDKLKKTVVVLPLSGLQRDFYHRARALGIKIAQWTPDSELATYDHVQIIMASIEHSVLDEFQRLVARLAGEKSLARIILDEAHLLVTSASFRKVMEQFFIFLAAYIQIVFLTGTLPDHLVPALQRITHISNFYIIRDKTDRPNIQYTVSLCPRDQLDDKVVRYVKGRTAEYAPQERMMVFFKTKTDANRVAKLLGVEAYTADLDMEARERIYSAWKLGTVKFICCTSVLSCGVDEPVTDVVHHGLSHSVIDAFQEDNRAGRNQKPGYSVYFVDEKVRPVRPNPERPFGEELLATWALDGSSCRKLMYTQFLDGFGSTCTSVPGSRECDSCYAMLQDRNLQPPSTPIPTPFRSSSGEMSTSAARTSLAIPLDVLLPQTANVEVDTFDCGPAGRLIRQPQNAPETAPEQEQPDWDPRNRTRKTKTAGAPSTVPHADDSRITQSRPIELSRQPMSDSIFRDRPVEQTGSEHFASRATDASSPGTSGGLPQLRSLGSAHSSWPTLSEQSTTTSNDTLSALKSLSVPPSLETSARPGGASSNSRLGLLGHVDAQNHGDDNDWALSCYKAINKGVDYLASGCAFCFALPTDLRDDTAHRTLQCRHLQKEALREMLDKFFSAVPNDKACRECRMPQGMPHGKEKHYYKQPGVNCRYGAQLIESVFSALVYGGKDVQAILPVARAGLKHPGFQANHEPEYKRFLSEMFESASEGLMINNLARAKPTGSSAAHPALEFSAEDIDDMRPQEIRATLV